MSWSFLPWSMPCTFSVTTCPAAGRFGLMAFALTSFSARTTRRSRGSAPNGTSINSSPAGFTRSGSFALMSSPEKLKPTDPLTWRGSQRFAKSDPGEETLPGPEEVQDSEDISVSTAAPAGLVPTSSPSARAFIMLAGAQVQLLLGEG